ncbi:MAG: PQQ-binding-like beta-propeller repeat protein [Planctomycetia bacterium]|nr:PQQ-binding-like beta-propeller repeat protein [Planctomycetia bacterium]
MTHHVAGWAVLLGFMAGVALPAESVRNDWQGDPLPPGVLARLGSERLAHQLPVAALAYSPDGRWLVSLGSDGQLSLWDANSGKNLWHNKDLAKAGVRESLTSQFGGANALRCSVRFSPDGSRLVVAGVDTRLSIIHSVHGSHDRSLPNWGGALAFAGNGKDLVALASAKKLTRRQLSDGKETVSVLLDRASTQLTPMDLAPNGQRLAVQEDGKVRVLDAETGKKVNELGDKEARRLDGTVGIVKFSPDGTILAVGSPRQIRLWDVATSMARLTLPLPGYGAVRLAFSPDGSVLAVSEPDRQRVGLWSIAEGKLLRAIESLANQPTALCFSPDGKVIAIGTGLRIERYEVETGKSLEERRGHGAAITSLAVSPDGRLVASGDAHGEVYLWESATGRPLHVLAAGRGAVRALAFTPDSRQLATVGSLASPSPVGVMVANPRVSLAALRLWDIGSGQELHCFSDRAKPGTALSFSPDGRFLAGSGSNSSATVWSVAERKEVCRVAENSKVIKALQFLPGGKRLLVGDDVGDKVYALDTGEEIASRADRASLGVFNPGGQLVVGRSTVGGPFALRDRATGTLVRVTGGTRDKVNLATTVFSPDGHFLAVASTDRHITLWETASGKEAFRWRPDGVNALLVFLPDGKAMVAGGADGCPLIWDLAPRRSQPDAIVPEMENLWVGLLADDARTAYQAAWTLAARRDVAVRFLRDHMRPAEPSSLSNADLDKLVLALDSDRFAERDQAFRTLRDEGQALMPYLSQALEKATSVEVSRSLERLLVEMEQVILKPTALRTVRAVRILEQVGSAEAVEVLRAIATGDPRAAETLEALAALERLPRAPRQRD